MSLPSSVLIALFFVALVAANVAVGIYGQAALIFTAWVLIPADMLVRDVLHDRWREEQLVLRMAALVAAGAAVSAALNIGAWRVSLASCVAFILAMLINGGVFEYAARRGASAFFRMNLSNAFAAVVDSLAFPLIAFASFDPALCLAQALSKFFGGLF